MEARRLKSMSIFRADGKQNYKIELFIPENRALWPCPAIWLHTFPGEGERIWSRLKNPCALICISGIHWNDDLSPWPAPAVMEKGGAFGGGAPAYLEYLTKTIIPRAEAALPFAPVQRGLTGYSMAGLFAVYAMYHASCFDFIGTMSGSLWFDGWLEYARTHRPVSPVKRMYVSLGSREHRVLEVQALRGPLEGDGKIHRVLVHAVPRPRARSGWPRTRGRGCRSGQGRCACRPRAIPRWCGSRSPGRRPRRRPCGFPARAARGR